MLIVIVQLQFLGIAYILLFRIENHIPWSCGEIKFGVLWSPLFVYITRIGCLLS